MKKIILFVVCATATIASYSQALGYEDLAILFSQNDRNGSARFMAMGGAFGALGGDVTALSVNPAGVSVFNNSYASIGFQSRSTDQIANYYENPIGLQQDYFDLSSAGAVFTFEDSFNDEWTNFGIGINYRILTDFDNSFLASGNSGEATFIDFPYDTNTTPLEYSFGQNQRFFNEYQGEVSELNLAFGGTYKDRLHVGVGLNFYDINFAQFTTLDELNDDGNGNTLSARLFQENFTTGTGVSLSAGFIFKVNKVFRFGVSYQSPTWFTEIIEDTNITPNSDPFNAAEYNGEVEIVVSEDPTNIYQNEIGRFAPRQTFTYRLRAPSKLTLSSAFIFGKIGLISVDYVTQDFSGLELITRNDGINRANFTNENLFFEQNLTATNTFNIGTEWRLNRFSFRGGYRYQESPDANARNSDHLQVYSAGLGYNFGTLKLNVAYSNSTRTGVYNFYANFPELNIDPAFLDIDNTIVTFGIAMSL